MNNTIEFGGLDDYEITVLINGWQDPETGKWHGLIRFEVLGTHETFMLVQPFDTREEALAHANEAVESWVASHNLPTPPPANPSKLQ